ncbi:MAG: phage portal protein, partial [Aquimonas sp.]|nr:phage portal protein [Aquimonas sp.]
ADGDLGALPSGGITELPPGLNLTAFDPKPEGGTVEYLKWQLHLIASGIGVPYPMISSDMNEDNFSSARIRIIDFRRDVEQMQWTVLVPRMLNRIWQWFCEAANFTGLPIDTAVEWSTPRWDYVNPQQDINAEVEAIKYGLMTPSESLRRRGYKPEQVFAELGSDFAALKESGALPFLQFLQGKPAADAEPTDPATPPKQGKRSAGDIPPMQLTLPAIHIHQSETRIEPPVVNVGGPTVNVERAEAPAVHVNVQPTPVTIDVQPAEVRADAPVIHVAAPNVTIQPAQVTVELEANIPPAEITLDLPTRKTTTDITRDSMGRIVSTTQIETDAE